MKDGSYKLDPLKTFEFLKTQSKENKVTVTIITYFKMFVIVIKNHHETKQLFESKYFQFKIISVGLVK